MKCHLLLFMSLLTANLTFAANRGDPSSLKLSIYKMAVSTSPLCTNLTTVIDNGDTPSEVEFIGGINIGSGTIVNGTYPCVVIEFNDNIKFTPNFNSDGGNCLSSAESTLDVCRDYNSNNIVEDGEFSTLIDGSISNCSSAVTGDRVAMYLTTASTLSNGGDSFNPPTTNPDSTKGLNLGSALVISGTSTAKFVVNGTAKVCDGDDSACNGSAGQCEMEPPLFSFTQL